MSKPIPQPVNIAESRFFTLYLRKSIKIQLSFFEHDKKGNIGMV
ncbi:hypothetical protein FM107_10395 [Sphingobacterium sp. JB170]|nr:hypothetical protein FM107_10395 [Sphingobacterium sp. JB170]